MSRLAKVASAMLFVAVCVETFAAGDSPFPDIERILERGKLVVALLAADAPPMIMTDEQGRPDGFEVELAQDIGHKLGVPVEFVRTAATYDGVVEVVSRGEADVAVSFLSRSVERAKRVYFTDPYVTQSARVVYNRVRWAELRKRYPELEEIGQIPKQSAAQAIQVGVLEGSVYAARLAREMPNLRVKTYKRFPEMMADVKSGKIFGGIHGEIQIRYYFRLHPGSAIHIGVEPKLRNPSDICIAVRPDAPNLLRWLNIYLANHVGVLDAAGVIERYEAMHAAEAD